MNAAAEALMIAPDVVSTTAMLLGAPRAMFIPGALVTPAEKTVATEDAKKLEGYVRVIKPPEKMAEVTGINGIARLAFTCPAMQS